MKDNDWKDRLGVMYSTNPDFQYNTGDTEEEDTLPKEKQALRISLDKRNREEDGYLDHRVPGHFRGSDRLGETLESEMRRRRLREGRGDNHPRGPACQGVGYPPERGLFEKPYDLIPDRYANNL